MVTMSGTVIVTDLVKTGSWNACWAADLLTHHMLVQRKILGSVTCCDALPTSVCAGLDCV